MAFITRGVPFNKQIYVGAAAGPFTCVSISKGGFGAWNPPSSGTLTIPSVPAGWLVLNLDAIDTDTYGTLAALITDGGGNVLDVPIDEVVDLSPGFGLGALPNDGTGGINVLEIHANLFSGLPVGGPLVIDASFLGDLTGDVNGSIIGNMTGNVQGAVLLGVFGGVTGDLTGNVTGNVGGNLGGDVAGNVLGNVAGNVAGSVASVTGNVGGNVGGNLGGSVLGDVAGNLDGSVLGSVGGNLGGSVLGRVTLDAVQPDYAPAKPGQQMDLINAPNGVALAAIAQAIWDLADAVESGVTPIMVMRLLGASQGGRSSLVGATFTIRDLNDTKDVVVASVDPDGQRIAVTLDLT